MIVMERVMKETVQAYLQASIALDGSDQYAKVWREYVMGYVKMHLISSRYMLSDIGLNRTENLATHV